MWFRSVFQSPTPPSPDTPRRPARPRLRLEALEDRFVPSFYAPVNYAVGVGPDAIAVGDFNGDARPDLVVANGTSNTVSVLLGNAAGTFQPARSFATGAAPFALGVGDFNGDGRLDVAMASTYGVSLTLLLGNGDGTLQPARALGDAVYEAVAPGDFSGDGRLDLVTTDYNHVSLFRGNGDATFQAAQTISLPDQSPPDDPGWPLAQHPLSVSAADLNSDGRLDLVVTAETVHTVIEGYIDQDGNPVDYELDVYNGYLNTLLNNGDGTFTARDTELIAQDAYPDSRPMVVADLTGDGKLDLALGDGNILPGNGDGTIQFGPSTGIWGPSVAADFNQDGRSDLATTYSVSLGNGDGTFRPPVSFAAGDNRAAVAVGDFNGDGFPDLAVANGGSDDVSVLLNSRDWRSLAVGGFPSPATAGEAGTITVTALDDRGNPLPSYTGTVHFTSTDAQAVLPVDYTFTAADNGTHTFAVILKTAGYQLVSVTDTGPTAFSGDSAISVNPAAAATLQISGFPSSIAIGDYGYFRVNAADAYGNAVANYAGTVRFTSSDGHAVLPGDYTFSGTYGYFSVRLATIGTQSLTVTDTVQPGLTATQAGIRVLPRATLSGPNVGLRNQLLTFTLGAVSGLPAGTVFTYAIDWNSDGVADQTVSGPSGTTLTHSYANSGRYNVGVTATVHVGAEDYTSDTASGSVIISAVTVTVQADPGDATRSALVVEGAADADSLTLRPGPGNAIALSVGGFSVGSFAAPGGAAFAHLLVYGQGGDDTIWLTGGLSVPALLFGGDGNDTLEAMGGGGGTANNVLVGGAGNDRISGGSGRELLIGGLGADALGSVGGDDILIGGYTAYDANVQGLLAAIREWSRIDSDYNTRVKHLQGSLSGGLNSSYFLTTTTVHDEHAIDSLYGSSGMDWFFVGGTGKKRDTVYNQVSGEVITTL